ncbi:DUF4267 domain-containing protein [Bacillus horti]|uniref:DUF4267 domain-containing protein n=1 Tax=Caldalkalibacillus horti TaxID=77523 RepID=A0ABT9VXH2_9BACI|nr:DUF4267 domain-containing protein [Bacillus horti]MDQ0165574.1 hypothetical protein [Bacillus horti]
MKEKVENKRKKWGPKSLSFWLIMVCAFGLIALGINGFIQPLAASRAFGLEIVSPLDSGYVRAKAARDLVLGISIIVLVFMRIKKVLIAFSLVSAIIPFIDGILVLTQYGGELKDSWQHFITMLGVLFISFLLWKEKGMDSSVEDLKKKAVGTA